jgi:DNA-binding XRE family transcriptional regulator
VIAGILATVATVIGDSLPAAVKRPGTLAEPLTRSLTGEKSTPTIATGDGGEWVPMNKKVPNPTDKYVGSRVRMRRLMLSMSQQKLGDALGLTFQQVQKYEKGTNRIGASRLQHIAQILQVDVPFFSTVRPVPMSKPMVHHRRNTCPTSSPRPMASHWRGRTRA